MHKESLVYSVGKPGKAIQIPTSWIGTMFFISNLIRDEE